MNPTQDSPHLLVLSAPEHGRTLPLDRDELILGRARHHYLIPSEKLSLSRQHARIHRQIDLFWLEDLESANGTFFTPPGVEEIRLPPHRPRLLLDGSQIRLGPFVRMQVNNIQTGSSESMTVLLQGLHSVIMELYRGLPDLDEYESQRHLDALHLFEKSLQAAQTPDELAHLVEIGIQSLENHLFKTIEPGVKMEPGEIAELPAIASDLARPDSGRLRTIIGTFITDIRICFPRDEGEPGDG